MKRYSLLDSFLLMIFLNFFVIDADAFVACNGTYALCTTAKCTNEIDKKGIVLCGCDVKTGYSAGAKQCQPIENTKNGQLIYSRYYPVRSYAICSNIRPWAWCLDKPCFIDKKNPSKAICICVLTKNQGDYVIVTDQYTNSTCTTGIISSATVKQSKDITDFLKNQNELHPFPIKVLNSE
jgi:hypothetical protein